MVQLKYIFNDYVIKPLYENTGYNMVNTLLYAIIFIAAIYLIYKYLFQTKRIVINERFVLSLSGWIVLGGLIRVMEDANLLNSLIFVTPFIYVLMFVIVLCFIYLSKMLKKAKFIKDEYRLLLYSGWFFVILSLFLLPIKNFKGIIIVISLWLVFGLILIIISSKINLLKNKWNFAAIQCQLLDACGSFVGITYYGFWEKHVLGRSLINLLESKGWLLINGSGAWVMFALKLTVIPIALYLIDKYGENDTEKKFIKLIIIILGLGIGTRNTIAVGVFG